MPTPPVPTTHFALPTDPNDQLLVGAVFAEASTKYVGGEDPSEKLAIAVTFVNCAYYAGIKKVGTHKCYNDSFGDGTLLGAIKTSSVAFGGAMWNKVMNGTKLKTAAELSHLAPGDAEHLTLSIEAVKQAGAGAGPKKVLALHGGVPVNFNKASDHPAGGRQQKIGKLGTTTFYGFIAGRECQ